MPSSDALILSFWAVSTVVFPVGLGVALNKLKLACLHYPSQPEPSVLYLQQGINIPPELYRAAQSSAIIPCLLPQSCPYLGLAESSGV